MLKLSKALQKSIVSVTYGETRRIDLTHIIKSLPTNIELKIDNNIIGDPEYGKLKYMILIFDDYSEIILKENGVIIIEN